MRSQKWRKWMMLLILGNCCESCTFFQEEKTKEVYKNEVLTHFGTKFNSERKKFQIHLLPINGWRPMSVAVHGKVGVCNFLNVTPGLDSQARYAQKEIYFYADNKLPIREIDMFYSGRKYIENDPDHYGWERMELHYDYVTDTLKDIEVMSTESEPHTETVKGRFQAFLVSPKQFLDPSHPQPQWRNYKALKKYPITMKQADSTLHSWGLYN